MSKRRIPDKPCVILAAMHTGKAVSCEHCDTPTDIEVELWLDDTYKNELIEQRGINREYAARLTMANAIRHQRKEGSRAFARVSLCEEHLSETIRVALAHPTTQAAKHLLVQFTSEKKLFVVDRNESDEMTAPRAMVGDFRDIHHFLDTYEELGEA